MGNLEEENINKKYKVVESEYYKVNDNIKSLEREIESSQSYLKKSDKVLQNIASSWTGTDLSKSMNNFYDDSRAYKRDITKIQQKTLDNLVSDKKSLEREKEDLLFKKRKIQTEKGVEK